MHAMTDRQRVHWVSVSVFYAQPTLVAGSTVDCSKNPSSARDSELRSDLHETTCRLSCYFLVLISFFI